MLAHEAVSVLSDIINDKSLVKDAQIFHNSFTRERKLPLHKLLTYLIFRNHNVLSQELVSFFGSFDDFDIPTRQAMIKRMSILNFDVWDTIMQRFCNEVYSKLPLIKIKDYLIIAVDGSFLDLPPHLVLNQYFGGFQYSDTKVEDIKKPQAKVSMIYDVLNKNILDFSIAHYKTSEIPLLFKHLSKLQSFFKDKKIILLADRYYGSAELFKYCEMHNIKYIVRAKKNFFKHYIEEHPGESDFTIDVKFDKNWIRRIKNTDIKNFIELNPTMNVRVVRGEYTFIEKNKSREHEVTVASQYFTNLDAKDFDTSDIISLYHCERWHVETAYDVLKNDLAIEQYNTHNPIGIINETMGKVIFYNIEKIVYMAAKNKIKQKSEWEYEYVPNNKHLINMLHHNLFVKRFRQNHAQNMLIKIIKSASKEKIPIRKGRHYKRWNKYLTNIPHAKHRIDGRSNPPVVKAKTGFVTTNH